MPEQPKASMLQSLRNWGGTSIPSLPDSPRRTCLTLSCITIEAKSLTQSFLYREFRTANTPRHPHHSPTCSSIPVLPHDVYPRLALLLLPELEQLQDRCCRYHGCMEWLVCIACYAEKSGMFKPFLHVVEFFHWTTLRVAKSNQKQGIKNKLSARGIVRGGSLALCAINVAGCGLAYTFGKREKEEKKA